MDLLFRGVMRYMVNNHNEKCGLMSLEELRNCIQSKRPKDLHKIYAYTDAQVFSKMRKLHEELDKKKEESCVTDVESYINDCVKTIMDGRIPEPVFPTCQKLVDLKKEKDYRRQTEDEVNEIANKVADKLCIYRERIKANLVEQEVMKYNERMGIEDGAEEEGNREAVRIMYKKSREGDKIIAAAKSNATILGNLSDKALLIFNVYYVPSKKEDQKKVEATRKEIKDGFERFVTEKFQS